MALRPELFMLILPRKNMLTLSIMFHVIVSSVTSNVLCALCQFAMAVQILSLAGTPITES